MKLILINRRTHLLLGLFLLPWMLMYGTSSLVLNHGGWFAADEGSQPWTVISDEPRQLQLPDDGSISKIGTRIMSAAGVTGPFNVGRRGRDRFVVDAIDFIEPLRLTYFADQGRLLVEQRRFRGSELLTRVHTRGGFRHDSWLDDVWAMVVDVFSLAMIVWIGTGLYMWLHLPSHRRWGILALAAGVLSFILLVARL